MILPTLQPPHPPSHNLLNFTATSNSVPFRLFHPAPLLETREDLKLFIVTH